jgi:hypothetical protein
MAICSGNYVYNIANNLCSAVVFPEDVQKVLVKSNRPRIVKHLRGLGSVLGWKACTMYHKRIFSPLTLILLTWKIWWAPNNAGKWQMGFNSAFEGLIRRQMKVAVVTFKNSALAINLASNIRNHKTKPIEIWMQDRQLMAIPIYLIANKGLCICVVIRGILKMFP